METSKTRRPGLLSDCCVTEKKLKAVFSLLQMTTQDCGVQLNDDTVLRCPVESRWDLRCTNSSNVGVLKSINISVTKCEGGC